jgi:flagellar motor switch protein FliN/FliY
MATSPDTSQSPAATESPTATENSAPAEGAADEALEDQADVGRPLDIEFLLDIPLQVSVEIGRTKMLINELLQLGQGSVIELQKLVGEPFEVLVNEKLIARGEVVVVNERFGVRLTDIISPMERIQQLG